MDVFSVGKMRVHRVEEWRGEFLTPELLFAGFDANRYAETRDGVGEAYLDHRTDAIQARIKGWVIEVGDKVILFDTGCGNHKVRPGIPVFANLDTNFLDRSAATGFGVYDIDLVVCSHVHVDHVGWNTRLDGDSWVPTFANARYVLPASDVEYWDPHNRHKFPHMIVMPSTPASSRTASGRSSTAVWPRSSPEAWRSPTACTSMRTPATRRAAR